MAAQVNSCEARSNTPKLKPFLIIVLYRNKQIVADAVLEKEYVPLLITLKCELLTFIRKNTEAAQVFGGGFSWPAALDAVADVYNGVSIKPSHLVPQY